MIANKKEIIYYMKDDYREIVQLLNDEVVEIKKEIFEDDQWKPLYSSFIHKKAIQVAYDLFYDKDKINFKKLDNWREKFSYLGAHHGN